MMIEIPPGLPLAPPPPPPLPGLLLASVLALALEPGLLVDTCCWDLRAGVTHASPGRNMLKVSYHVNKTYSSCSSECLGCL